MDYTVVTSDLIVMDYTIVTSDSIVNLINDVKRLIKNSWEPLGGMVVQPVSHSKPIYYQTMVKKQ